MAHIQKLSNDKLLYEIPYHDNFLHEIIYRMINRKKPCNQKGEEFRDVVLWLTIKNLLKKEKSVGFISNNSNEFASSDKTDLHPDLRVELDKEKLELKYYKDLDDFIKSHTIKVEYITKEWIEKELSKTDLNNLIIEYFIDAGLPGFWADEKFDRNRNYSYAYPISVSVALDDFYVYEMTNGEILINLIFSVITDIEAEIEIIRTKIFEKETHLELSAKIINEELKELEVEQQYD